VNFDYLKEFGKEESDIFTTDRIERIKRKNSHRDSQLIIGFTGAVGSCLKEAANVVESILKSDFNYHVEQLRISTDVLEPALSGSTKGLSTFERIWKLMDVGNNLRETTKEGGIIAKVVCSRIHKGRKNEENQANDRNAYLIRSFKHPDEIRVMREVYGSRFFLVGVYSEEKKRKARLRGEGVSPPEAKDLIKRDQYESEKFGQRARDTFSLSDFYISYDDHSSIDRATSDLKRMLDLVFGHPHITPTFDEFSMFMAFSASLRSADLSRQVGAVITSGDSIIATGANDVPKFGGGLYWPERCDSSFKFKDLAKGRDRMRGYDSNVKERLRIMNKILKKFDKGPERDKVRKVLENSQLADLTEYGRPVHAEMAALSDCSRLGLKTNKANLYCTTFPCHNCAKHIISSGIRNVVFMEPYPKSKTLEFYNDSSTNNINESKKKVYFRPFVGVGPRRFFEFFSMSQSFNVKKRKNRATGKVVGFDDRGNKIPNVANNQLSFYEKEFLTGLRVEASLDKKIKTEVEDSIEDSDSGDKRDKDLL